MTNKYRELKIMLWIEDLVGKLFLAISIVMIPLASLFGLIRYAGGPDKWTENAIAICVGIGLVSLVTGFLTLVGSQMTKVFIDMESSLSNLDERVKVIERVAAKK